MADGATPPPGNDPADYEGPQTVPTPESRTDLVKSVVIGREGETIFASNARASDLDTRVFQGLGAIPQPYSPRTLNLILEHSNSLRPNIDAYRTNIDGFGHRLEPVLDFEADETPEIIETALIEQQILAGKDPVVPTREQIDAKIEEIKRDMRLEKSRIDFFYRHVVLDESFIELRRKTRQDLEVTGNGYWEVLRSMDGRIAQFVYLPTQTIRIMRQDKEWTEIEQRVMKTAISYDKRMMRKKFRKYVQVFEGRTVWFKELGDPRVVSAKSGKIYGTPTSSDEFADIVAKMQKAEGDGAVPATEILHFRIHSPRTPYGVPRWIGALLAVLGSRQAEEVNFLFFENKSVPPMALLVSGGRVSEETVTRIESFIENNIRGRKNFWKMLVLEADGTQTQGGSEHTGRMKIELKPLMQAIQQDALFQNYDERNIGKVGMAFRLPPLLRGDSRDMNRSTSQSVLKFTEQQVFAPERNEFDDIQNRRILSDLEVCYWRFVSNSPKTTDPEDQAKIVAMLAKEGGLVAKDVRDLAEDILNRKFDRIKEPWTLLPVRVATSGRVENLLNGQLAGEGGPKPGPVEPDDSEKGLTSGGLAAGGLLQPAQGGKFRPLPRSVVDEVKHLVQLNSELRRMEAEETQKRMDGARTEEGREVLTVPAEEWAEWERGFIPAGDDDVPTE